MLGAMPHGAKAVFLALVLGLSGCGDDASGSFPSHPPPDTPGPGADPGVLMAAWGTSGSSREEGVSPGGHARCNLEDVRTDDLDLAAFDLEVPKRPYPDEVVHDAQAHCGADPDTLLFRLVNCERLSRGLSPYRCDLRAQWAARRHTADQVKKDFMGHEGSDGSSLADRANDANLAWSALGENVAYAGSVLQMHLSWMDSEGHRANILSTTFEYMGASAGAKKGGGVRGTEFFAALW